MGHIYIKQIISLIICFTTYCNINAQVKTKIFNQGIPAQLTPINKSIIPEKIITAPVEFIKLLSRVKPENPVEYSNKFAIPVKIDLDILANAKEIEEKNTTTFAITINAEKVLNISLQFNNFFLSEHSVLSIYTENELTDSITAKENNENKVWATRVYQGNKLTIVLRLPSDEKEQVSLKINQVNFGFKKFGTDYFGNTGASAPCNINVICPEGNGWQNERNSVALIVVNGQENCTGSLVMNTCNTNIPYFLTANHCLSGNVANWVFQFQTWSATCIGNTGWREDVQFNGATLRANNVASDFALLQLNQTPQPNSGINYSGWNRNANAPNGSVCLHHPEGDLMKFSRDFDPSGVSSWGGVNNHWVSVFEQGTVEPGSSGSPLYDMNHRIVGQLHGDQQNQGNYCAQRRGEYGRFDISWTGGGTNATRLSNWLDPNNSGSLTTNTTNISLLTQEISGDNTFCTTSNNYTITNLPPGATVIWSTTPSNIAHPNCPTCPTGTTLAKDNDGTITLTATISNVCGGPITINKTGIQVGIPFSESNTFVYAEDINIFVSHPPEFIVNAYKWEMDGVFYRQTNAPMLKTTQALQCHDWSVSFVTACGESSLTYPVSIGCDGFTSQYSVYPNPATSNITIDGTKKNKSIKEIQIADKLGNIKKISKYSGDLKIVNFNVSGLSSDIYYIRIFDGQKWESKQLRIQ